MTETRFIVKGDAAPSIDCKRRCRVPRQVRMGPLHEAARRASLVDQLVRRPR
jgi:hypothetical protein